MAPHVRAASKFQGGTLTPVDKEHVGSCPKMFLFALDELSCVYQCIDNTDARCIIAYKMLSFASDRCTERCNRRPKPEHDTFGPTMPHINLGDVGSLKRLAWAIYDGMYVLGSQPALSGLCDWACIINKMTTHIFHGRMLWEHWLPSEHHWRHQRGCCWPPERGPAVKPSRRRNWQKRPQAPWAPAFPASKTPTLWSVVNMPSGVAVEQ